MGTIRLLLALSVVSDHLGKYNETWLRIIGGMNAVQCFFIISGFYITLALNEKYKSVKSFYFNRFIKIFPMYWMTFFVGAILTYFVYGSSIFNTIFEANWHISAKIFFLFANIFIFGSSLMIFLFPTPQGLQFTSNFNDQNPVFAHMHEIPTAWSLPLELIFYLVAPFIFKSKRILFLLMCLSVLARAYTISKFGNRDPWNYRFLPSEMLFFCGGSFSYYLYTKIKKLRFSIAFGSFLYLGTIFYLLFFFKIQKTSISLHYFNSDHLFLLLPMFFVIPFIFLATKESHLDFWIGKLSYPIYLNQFLVMRFDSYLPKLFNLRSFDIFVYSIFFAILTICSFQKWIDKKFKI